MSLLIAIDSILNVGISAIEINKAIETDFDRDRFEITF